VRRRPISSRRARGGGRKKGKKARVAGDEREGEYFVGGDEKREEKKSRRCRTSRGAQARRRVISKPSTHGRRGGKKGKGAAARLRQGSSARISPLSCRSEGGKERRETKGSVDVAIDGRAKLQRGGGGKKRKPYVLSKVSRRAAFRAPNGRRRGGKKKKTPKSDWSGKPALTVALPTTAERGEGGGKGRGECISSHSFRLHASAAARSLSSSLARARQERKKKKTRRPDGQNADRERLLADEGSGGGEKGRLRVREAICALTQGEGKKEKKEAWRDLARSFC